MLGFNLATVMSSHGDAGRGEYAEFTQKDSTTKFGWLGRLFGTPHWLNLLLDSWVLGTLDRASRFSLFGLVANVLLANQLLSFLQGLEDSFPEWITHGNPLGSFDCGYNTMEHRSPSMD